MNYEPTIGSILLIVLGLLYLLLLDKLFKNGFNQEENKKIRKCIGIAIALHFLWGILVYIFFHYRYYYLVYDDETYHEFASKILNEDYFDSVNWYYYSLRFMYSLFGETTLTGRIINSTISISTIYPIAQLEKSFNKDTKFYATKFYALSPFILFISFFEIKDIILTFTFTLSYLIVKKQKESFRIHILILLILLSIVNENYRSGTGVLPLAVLAINMATKFKYKVIDYLLIPLCVCASFYIIMQYGKDYLDYADFRIDRYQNWIYTQFSASSTYNFYVISDPKDLWKAPLCFLLYTLQPVNRYLGEMRYYNEFGIIAKFLDVPILFFSVIFIPQYILKEKWNSILFLSFYFFNSCINLTNARQGFFLYPIMYIIFFDAIYSLSKSNGSILSYKNFIIVLSVVYSLWFAYVSYRIIGSINLI